MRAAELVVRRRSPVAGWTLRGMRVGIMATVRALAVARVQPCAQACSRRVRDPDAAPTLSPWSPTAHSLTFIAIRQLVEIKTLDLGWECQLEPELSVG